MLGIHKLTSDSLQLDLNDYSLANSIIRATQATVETFAFDLMIPEINTSSRDNFFIVSRIAQVSLDASNTNKLNRYDQCVCREKGCNLCQILFTLDVTADSNHMPVSSLALKTDSDLTFVLDTKLKPPKKPLILFELDKGEQVKLRLYARIGIGQQHAKWCPVIRPGIHYKAIVSADIEDLESLNQVCSRGVFSDYKNSQINHSLCDMCEECVRWAEQKNKTVTVKESGIIRLTFKTQVLSPKECLLRAISSLILRLTNVMKQDLDMIVDD